jgi:hypothetical protein
MATVASAYAKADIRSDELFQLMATESANRPFDDASQWADLVVLNGAFEHFGIDSGIIRETITRVKQQREMSDENERRAKVKSMVSDLLTTSVMAAFVLIVAALMRMYFSA